MVAGAGLTTPIQTMLSKEEFFSRFSRVVPGTPVPGIELGTANSDVYFEPLSMAGLEEMHRYSKDPRLYEFFEFDPFDTIDKTRAYVEKLEARMGGDLLDKKAMYWFVRRKSDGYLVGTAALVSLDYGRQSIEWGYGVDPELWGQGYILPIEEILKQFVFEVLELNRLYGMTMITNERTIASLLSSGMKHEGTLRKFFCKKGIYIDAWQYAMLREEYFAAKLSSPSAPSKYTIQDVVEIVRSVLTEEDVDPESTMRTLLSWDSLSHMSIMVAVSEKTGIALSPSEMMRANSVRALADILSRKR